MQTPTDSWLNAAVPRRRGKSSRRALIIETSLRILAERGMQGLNHRAVSEVAGLPQGSSAYYFPHRDSLAIGAMERAVADYRDRLKPLSDNAAAFTTRRAAEFLTGFVHDRLSVHRDRSLAEYELRLAARRRPELHGQAIQFHELLTNALARHVRDTATVRLACATITGYILQELTSHTPPDRAEIFTMVRQALGLDR
ncbi:TetR/AcrR family transcriptional regulator [Nocardia brasiliensis]|uniref:TetR/AcrR family transcriptional regulator n=1 Tax=Nocardia brasiliensis TaxID=37326 RepID=UPI0037A9D2C1